MHPVYVFVRQSKDGLTVPVKKMNNTGWRRARTRGGCLGARAWDCGTGGIQAREGSRSQAHVWSSLTSGGRVV
jgi:hypothetical protein